MRALLSRLFLILIALSGCSSGSESGPVSLPIPFSGSLTADTRVVNSNGLPISEGVLFGHLSGKSWDLVDPSGTVGSLSFNLESMTRPTIDRQNSDKRTFTMTECFVFDDTSSVCGNLEYIDFLYDIPPTFDLAAAAPGEAGVKAVMTRGVASGLITVGEGRFEGAKGKVIQYNYVYGWVEHSDGTRTFFQHQIGTTLIQGIGGDEQIFAGLVSSLEADQHVAIWIPNGFSFVNSEGAVVTPLFCEGNVDTTCATEEDTVKGMTVFNKGIPVDMSSGEVEFDEVEFVADSRFCETDDSCFTARNARFRGHRVPELDQVVRNLIITDFQDAPGFSQAIIDGGRAMQGTMTDHDPILCEDTTGRFMDIVCSGRELRVDFRCEDFVNFQTGEFFAYGGGFTISAGD